MKEALRLRLFTNPGRSSVYNAAASVDEKWKSVLSIRLVKCVELNPSNEVQSSRFGGISLRFDGNIYMLHRSKERSHQVDFMARARAAFRLRIPATPFSRKET